MMVIFNKSLIKFLKISLLAEDNLHVSPLERSYKGKVLAHYPENVPLNPFDGSAVCMVISIVMKHDNILFNIEFVVLIAFWT